MVDPSSDSQSKIQWANEHLITLDGFADQFLGTEPYAAVPHFEANGLEKVWTLEVRAEPWPRIGLAIGDVVHNARSALDAAVVSLAGHALRVHSRRALTEDEERKLQFPICKAKDEFAERAKRCLSSVPPAAQAFIEGCQPYNGADFGALAIVERLSNGSAAGSVDIP